MKKFINVFALLMLFGCAENSVFDYSQKTDEEIYKKGLKEIQKEDYVSAISTFEQIEYNHPYSALVANAWYLSGYASYKNKKYANAIDYFEKLLKFQPNHPQADYALYMISMAYYDQISPVSRDQKMTELAYTNMKKLVNKYPDSKYAKDVKSKMSIAKNDLAAKEMYIANSLMKNGNIIAALNRYQTVIKKYETTLFVPEAIYRTVEIYNMINEPVDAKNMTKLLEINFPESDWYKLALKITK